MHKQLLVALLTMLTAAGTAAAQEQAERSDAEQAAIAKVRDAGGSVMEIARNDQRLEVAFHLADGEIEDDHLAPLKDMPSLVNLNLRGTDITDEGLEHLKDLTGLVRLHLERTGIGDAGLVHLAGLENLEYLNLYGTKVTDAGLAHLEALKKLKKLYLWQTEVTDTGVETLKQTLPEIEVIRGVTVAAEEQKEAEE